jgi:hypothetical protein
MKKRVGKQMLEACVEEDSDIKKVCGGVLFTDA